MPFTKPGTHTLNALADVVGWLAPGKRGAVFTHLLRVLAAYSRNLEQEPEALRQPSFKWQLEPRAFP